MKNPDSSSSTPRRRPKRAAPPRLSPANDSEPIPHDPAAYNPNFPASSSTSDNPPHLHQPPAYSVSSAPSFPTAPCDWPALHTINVARCHTIKAPIAGDTNNENDWQSYHWEGVSSFGHVRASMQEIASAFVAGFSSRSIPGTLYWDSAVRHSLTGFGLVALKQIHRRIHLATRIHCTQQAHGVDCLVIQDLILIRSVRYSATKLGILLAAIPIGLIGLVAILMMPGLIIAGSGLALIFLAAFALWVFTAELGIKSITRFIFGDPRRALTDYPTIVSTRNSIMHLLSDLRDSVQSAQ